ncbi:MAG TPA: type III-A CRISPR-associated RAMP protein Csm5 [Blastocatellia bacterium]|nr:type III-A CRISPR-associated RAMP protein Csm5 [Blastocatellia bacterium]
MNFSRSWRYEIETIAPVHIGTGDQLTALEYHIVERPGDGEKQFAVPNLSSLFAAKPEEAEAFGRKLAGVAAESLAQKSLKDFLSVLLLNNPAYHCYTLPFLEDAATHLMNEQQRGQGQVRVATRTPAYEAYIPGSSLKGAFRTAWAYHRIKENPEAVGKIVDEINSSHSKKPENDADRLIAENIFRSPVNSDAGFDLFRCLQIGDTQPVPANQSLILVAERVLSAGARAEQAHIRDVHTDYKNYWLFLEAIDEKQRLNGRLQWAEALLQHERARKTLGWAASQQAFTLPQLMQAVNGFALDLIEWELDYLDQVPTENERVNVDKVYNFYLDLRDQIAQDSENTCWFSLGHGSGWHKLTIGLLLEQHLAPAQFSALRQALRLADRHTEFVYPKSRKLAMRDAQNAYAPFGWIKFQLQEDTK